MTPFETAIKQYLDKRAEDDALFAQAYAKRNKSLNECCNYILSQAKEANTSRAQCLAMRDEDVFSLAVHYYDEDDIQAEDMSGVAVEYREALAKEVAKVQLTDEDRAQARQMAIQAEAAKIEMARKNAEDKRRKAIAEAKKAEAERSAQATDLLFTFDD